MVLRPGVYSSNNDAAHPEVRTIRERNDGRRRTEEEHTRLKVKAAFFYADKKMVASINPGWIQTAFYMLTGFSNRVELNTNVKKTVGIVCHPCQAAGVWSEEAYTWWVTGEDRGYN